MMNTTAHPAQQSFFAQISQQYGQPTATHYKNYASTYSKLGNMQNRKRFLIKCRQDGLLPTHIVHSLKCVHELIAKRSPLHYKLSKAVLRLQKTILNIEIEDTFHQLHILSQQAATIKQQIISLTTPEHHTHFFFTQEFAYYRNYHIKAKQTDRKHRKLIAKNSSIHDSIPTVNQKALFNATNKPTPPETSILLSMGPKFALPYTDICSMPLFHVIADIENILTDQKDSSIRETTRCQLINKMQNFIHHRISTHIPTPLEKFCKSAVTKTNKFIRDNPDILIVDADKGNRTVIMYVEDYNNKMQQLLSDTNTYKLVRSDPTRKIQTQNNSIVQRLFALKLLDRKTKHRLACSNGTCPRIYGQPNTA